MASMQARLSKAGLWSSVLKSAAVQALLDSIQIEAPEPAEADREAGKAKFGIVENALGVFDLNLVAPGDPRDYVLDFTGPAGARTGFRLAVSLNEGPQKPLFTLLQKLPGHALKAAVRKTSPDGEWLEEVPGGKVELSCDTLWLVLRGSAGGSVDVLLSPNSDPPDGIVVLALQPSTVLLGGTGFGLEIPSGIAFDDADDAVPPGRTVVDGVTLDTPADKPAWRGIAVRTARFYLPKGVPFLGGHAVEAHLQIGRSPTPGIDLLVLAKVPPKNERPGIDVRIECRDPTASGLDGFVPTLVEAVMELPVAGRTEPGAPGGALTFGGGKPVKVRARFSRTPSAAGVAPKSELSLAVESQGADGLVKIDSTGGGFGAKVAVTAATVASALVADGHGPALHTLLTAAVGLSSFLDAGQLVLHRAEILTSGSAAPVGAAVQLKIDYSVAAVVTGIDVGVMSVQMHPNQPLRVRVREVVLTIDPEQSGLDMVSLDYAKSSLEVEDPGGWKVHGPDSLFDVLGTRSGRGSLWIEVDLRFKLELGPVKVSGATIRATLDAQGRLSGSLRGLDASIALLPMISGAGGVQLTEHGFRAALAASILPLGLGASADVETNADMVKLALGVDLPGPIPLGSTGLGIYGIGGVFAANGRPAPPPAGSDAIQFQLDWDYRKAGSFVPAPAFSFGLEAVVGTAPDMGFTFSARAGIFVTVPDVVVRGAVQGRYMGPRVEITRDDPIAAGLQAKGVIVIDPADAVTVAVAGTYTIPHILEVVVPVAARFPTRSADWFIHLGADGWTPPAGGKSEGRERGPVRSTLLPEILGQTSDAYMMFRGDGITAWPRGGRDASGPPKTFAPGSFVSAFGFGFNAVWGLKPIVWAELFARADVLISTHPMTMAAMGRVGGGLHVGPFSIGVDAGVLVVLMENTEPYFHAEVCGTIDLFLDEIRKCVSITYHSEPKPTMPPPGAHPLDGRQSVVSDKYEVIGPLFGKREDATEPNAVWPDAIPLLSFATAPKLALASAQFPKANSYPQGERAKPIGGELLHYDWELLDVALVDATDPNVDKAVAGTFSAAWLDGKFGDAGGQAQPAELALLTPFGDLWFDALPDAGSGLAHDPLGARAGICRLQVAARPGWALGALAAPAGDGYALPPDTISNDPLQSQVRAYVELRWQPSTRGRSFVLDRFSAHLLPAMFAYAAPITAALASAVELDGQAFDTFLDLGGSLLPPGSVAGLPQTFVGPTQQLRVTFDEPLRAARLWLVVPRRAWSADRFQALDNLTQVWAPDRVEPLGADRVAVRFVPPGPAETVALSIVHPIGTRLGVLGVFGTTHSAAAAADARNAATKAEADALAKAAADGPPKPGAPPSETTRCVLAPGRVYRLDVTMRWSGELSKLDDKGNKVVIASQAADGTTDSTRQFWFRTAKAHGAGGLATIGTSKYFEQMYRQRDLFDPALLERYLRGYEPAQSELFRFADDPVRMHFGVGHVGALAGAYGYTLRCGLRRLDAPAEVEPDKVLATTLLWPTSTQFLVGPEAVKTQAYLESPCALPPTGAVAQARAKLSRLCWYEVFALAKSTKAGVIDGRLPGVSFRTSRWGGGAEMLRALRFLGTGAGEATGGLALRGDAVLAPLVVAGDDAAFDAALDRLGLDGWPAPAEPRISLLWREQAGAWRCAGVFVESPEPIHRPGRFEVDQLTLSMGSASNAVAFDIRLRDRSGSRLLFATSSPFVPRRVRSGVRWRDPQLRIASRDLPIGGVPKSLQGWLHVPLQPSFAEEAV